MEFYFLSIKSYVNKTVIYLTIIPDLHQHKKFFIVKVISHKAKLLTMQHAPNQLLDAKPHED